MAKDKPEEYAKSPRPLPKPKLDEWACPHCGGINPAGIPNCGYCGLKAQGAYMKFSTGKNVNVGIKAETPEFIKKGGREPPTVLPKGAGILSSIIGAISGGRKGEKESKAPEEFKEWYTQGSKGAAEAERKIIEEETARKTQIEKEYKEEEEKARRVEVEAEELQAQYTQEKHDREKRGSFSKGEKSFGGFWENQAALLKQQPRPCQTCGRIVPADELNRNAGRYCDQCNAKRLMNMKGKEPMQVDCWHCGSPVDLRMSRKCTQCGYVINPMKCPQCHKWIDRNAPDCRCGWVNKAHMKTSTSITEITAKGAKGKLYEIFIYIIAGIAVIFVPPFFGLPSFRWIGLVLIAFMPFYTYLPSEHDVLRSIERGVEDVPAGKKGLLILKAMVKILMFIFIGYFELFFINRLLSLIFSFLFYISMPVSYKESEPFKLIESWARIGIGFYLSFLVWLVFGLTTPVGLSLFCMSLAFFAIVIPTHKAEKEEGVVKLIISKKLRDLKEGSSFRIVDKMIFLILMLCAAAFSGLNFMKVFDPTGMTEVTFLAVWGLSLFSGLLSDPEARPFIGIFMIFIAIFTFTFTYTGIIGSTIFGYWWPQVEAVGQAIFEPLGPMWAQVQTGFSDSWLMITNPAAYMDAMNKRNQATKSVVTEGGTTRSIELTKTDLFTSITNELEPINDPLVGSFEIQNQGEFEANRIDLKLWASWQDPKAISATDPKPPIITGKLDPDKFSCSQTYQTQTTENSDSIGVCNWTETTYPKEIRIVNFLFKNDQLRDADYWNLESAGNLADCINYDGTDMPCDHESGNATFKHSGEQVRINVNLTYDYNVNVSIPLEVIEQNKYRILLQAKLIGLQEYTSQYTGGPVKATIWTQKQPIRGNETSLFVASIVNEGSGSLNIVRNFTILIPKELVNSKGDIDIISQTFQTTKGEVPPNGCGKAPIDFSEKYWAIECQHNVPMKTGEYKRVSFFITPNKVEDRKTNLIVGLANYEYTKTGAASVTVANAPWH